MWAWGHVTWKLVTMGPRDHVSAWVCRGEWEHTSSVKSLISQLSTVKWEHASSEESLRSQLNTITLEYASSVKKLNKSIRLS